MHRTPRRPFCTLARLLALGLLLLGATAAPARRRLAEATDVVLSVPRGRAPYISTAPTKFVQADFGQLLSSQTQPLELIEISGAARRGCWRPPPPLAGHSTAPSPAFAISPATT